MPVYNSWGSDPHGLFPFRIVRINQDNLFSLKLLVAWGNNLKEFLPRTWTSQKLTSGHIFGVLLEFLNILSCILCEKPCSLQLPSPFATTAHCSSKAVSMHYWKCYRAMLDLFFLDSNLWNLATLPQQRTTRSPKPAVQLSFSSA